MNHTIGDNYHPIGQGSSWEDRDVVRPGAELVPARPKLGPAKEDLLIRTYAEGAAIGLEDGPRLLNEEGGLWLLDDPAFEKGVRLTNYSLTMNRMGLPKMTATLMHPTCLDDKWTGREYVEFMGERYFVRNVPTSKKESGDARFEHSLELVSEREILAGLYFFDVVTEAGRDYKPSTNSTAVKFYGTIREFASRVNCALLYAGVGDSLLLEKTSLVKGEDEPAGDGYCVMVDASGPYGLDEDKEAEFEDQYIWAALTQAHETWEVPFACHGRRIVFGEESPMLSVPLAYGADRELTSISKNNKGGMTVNEITAVGSSDNIPYYYPNDTEYGHISVELNGENVGMTRESQLSVARVQQMISKSRPDEWITYHKYVARDANPGSEIEIWSEDAGGWDWYPFRKACYFEEFDGRPRVRLSLGVSSPGEYDVRLFVTTWVEGNGYTSSYPWDVVEAGRLKCLSLSEGSFEQRDDWSGLRLRFERACHVTMGCELRLEPASRVYLKIHSAEFPTLNESSEWWEQGGKKIYRLGSVGVRAEGMEDGDSFRWTSSGRMPFQERLMPPMYRNTGGEERFYKALNGQESPAYLNEDTEEPYEFASPWRPADRRQYVYKDEEIKPEIKDVRNSDGQLFGEIAAVAYDQNDNDSLRSGSGEDSAEYEHSFFYVKLRRLSYVKDGEDYSLDLFALASQKEAMTMQMRTGRCAGCKFKVQAVETTESDGLVVWKNPVQVGEDGEIVEGDAAQKVIKGRPQDMQQDTRAREVWIALQKDTETYGVIMPNREHEYLVLGAREKAAEGDLFNITGIELPKCYVLDAERRLEKKMMERLVDLNEEKFAFDETSSKIYFAENPRVLEELSENSRVRIEYNGRAWEQYVSSVTIECREGEPLPDVKISLDDSIEARSTLAQRITAGAVDMVKAAVGEQASESSRPAPEINLDAYVRKDKDERTEGTLSSDKGFEVGGYVPGLCGGMIGVNSSGSFAEVDYLKVRKSALFERIEVASTRAVGAQAVLTPGGGAKIGEVVEEDGFWRCFYKEDAKAASFVEGDLIFCKTYSGNAKYYWRRCVGVGEGWFSLSMDDCDEGSGAPEPLDEVVQLGHAGGEADRGSAIVLASVGAGSPSLAFYSGISGYSLYGLREIDMGVEDGIPRLECFGGFYAGPKDMSSYLMYDPASGKLSVRAEIDVESPAGGGTIGSLAKTSIDAGIVTTGEVLLGTEGNVRAGVSGSGEHAESVRFWAGSDNGNSAPWRVDQSGRMVAEDAVVIGDVQATSLSSFANLAEDGFLKSSSIVCPPGESLSFELPSLGPNQVKAVDVLVLEGGSVSFAAAAVAVGPGGDYDVSASASEAGLYKAVGYCRPGGAATRWNIFKIG